MVKAVEIWKGYWKNNDNPMQKVTINKILQLFLHVGHSHCLVVQSKKLAPQTDEDRQRQIVFGRFTLGLDNQLITGGLGLLSNREFEEYAIREADVTHDSEYQLQSRDMLRQVEKNEGDRDV